MADTREDPDFIENEEIDPIPLSELCAPVWVGDELWGAINVEEVAADAFDEDDARLLQTVADQLGSALRSALLYEQLDRAYLGTAEALATALEAKDSYTAHHAHSIVQWAEAVGREFGMDEAALRDLRYGAVFHDIGKIAIPEAILNKQGPLDDDERAIMERHTSSASRSSRRSSSWPACARSSATSTSAGTAAATPTACAARTSRWARGSCSCATPTTR